MNVWSSVVMNRVKIVVEDIEERMMVSIFVIYEEVVWEYLIDVIVVFVIGNVYVYYDNVNLLMLC